MIGIIDYGVGNIKAFTNIQNNLNISYKIVNKVDDFQDVSKLILPGVGAFDHAMNRLNDSGMREKLDELVLIRKLPILGICVGLQMLPISGDEGVLRGLGWIDGRVKKIDANKLSSKMPLPHMGWNSINIVRDNPLLKNLDKESRYYFLHSYYIECNDTNDVLAYTEYGEKFSSLINHENIYGIQPHPEKSHNNGITLLKNFGEL